MRDCIVCVLLALACCLAMTSDVAAQYNQFMKKKIKETLGDDYKDFQQFSYPTDNFGLVTSYRSNDLKNRSNKLTKKDDFICDMWFCMGIKDGDIPKQPDRLMMNGLAGFGRDGAKPVLNASEQRDLGINFLLPEIFRILKVGGGFNKKAVITIDLQIGEAFPRKLRLDEFDKLITNPAASQKMKDAYSKGALVIITEDVVVNGFKATVTLDQLSKQSVDAALLAGGEAQSGTQPTVKCDEVGAAKTQAAAATDSPSGGGSAPAASRNGTAAAVAEGQEPKALKIFKDAKLNLQACHSNDGTYTFEVKQPVIVFYKLRRQPKAGELDAQSSQDLSKWPVIAVNERRIRADQAKKQR